MVRTYLVIGGAEPYRNTYAAALEAGGITLTGLADFIDPELPGKIGQAAADAVVAADWTAAAAEAQARLAPG